MDSVEIVAPRANGEAVFWSFFQKWLLGFKMAKMTFTRIRNAGSQCTLFKPLFCPKNGESLKV